MSKHDYKGGNSKVQRAEAKAKGLHVHNGHAVANGNISPRPGTFVPGKAYRVAGRRVAYAGGADRDSVFVAVSRDSATKELGYFFIKIRDGYQNLQSLDSGSSWDLHPSAVDSMVEEALSSTHPYYETAAHVARKANLQP